MYKGEFADKASSARSDAVRAHRGAVTGSNNRALLAMQQMVGNRACVAHIVPIQRQLASAPTLTPGAEQLRSALAANPQKAGNVADSLEAAQRGAPREASSLVNVVVPPLAPITVASSELAGLIAEAKDTSRGNAAEAVRDVVGSAALTQGNVQEGRQRLAQVQALVDDPTSLLLPEDRVRLAGLVAAAVEEVGRYEKLASEGSSRTSALAGMGVLAGGVVADDATVVGTVDDVALPFIGLAALVTLAVTRPAPPQADLARAWEGVTRSLGDVANAGTGIVLAVQGERLAGNTRQLAVHLARLLALAGVGGMPSGEPPKRNDDNDKHWWSEIKAFLRSIGQATKGASRRQIMREFLRQGFTEEQILEIAKRIAEAAIKMGENVPPLLPPP